MCNGVEKPIPPKMEIFESQEISIDAQDYFEEKEYRLYRCLKYKECK